MNSNSPTPLFMINISTVMPKEAEGAMNPGTAKRPHGTFNRLEIGHG
jgi:hypothetical protein